MYEMIADLAAKNIDTKQLLGLIKTDDDKDESEEKYTYEDDGDSFDEIEDGRETDSSLV